VNGGFRGDLGARFFSLRLLNDRGVRSLNERGWGQGVRDRTPAPTVALVDSSIRMNAPVRRLRA